MSEFRVPQLPRMPIPKIGGLVAEHTNAMIRWSVEFNTALDDMEEWLRERYGVTPNHNKQAIIPPVPHPDAHMYFETVLDVVTDCQKRTGRHPETLRMSTRTANILGSLAVLGVGEKLDVTKGGTVAGVPFELDDALPDGAIQST